MVERFKIFKVAVVLILMYRFHAIIVKIHARFFGGLGGFVCLFVFCRNWQADPKIHMEIQGIQNSQNNLEQNWKTYWLQNLLQRNSHQDCLIVAWDRNIAQWNRTESPEICRDIAWDAGDMCSNPELGRSPGGGNGNPLWYSCLKYPMDRGAWQVTVMGSQRIGLKHEESRENH